MNGSKNYGTFTQWNSTQQRGSKFEFSKRKLTIAKCWKQPKSPSVNEWIKKLWYIYTREYYSAERKKKLLPFMTAWMELESIMLSEIAWW